MKTISGINYTALAFPVFFGLAGLYSEEHFIYALLFTAIAGAVQVILAVIMLFKYPGKLLYIYSTATFLYFLFYMITKSEEIYMLMIPPMLAIFFTVIIFIERQKEKSIYNK